eukprot:scaffold11.g3872.t1
MSSLKLGGRDQVPRPRAAAACSLAWSHDGVEEVPSSNSSAVREEGGRSTVQMAPPRAPAIFRPQAVAAEQQQGGAFAVPAAAEQQQGGAAPAAAEQQQGGAAPAAADLPRRGSALASRHYPKIEKQPQLQDAPRLHRMHRSLGAPQLRGAAQALDRAASPGALGALTDAVRLLIGTRVGLRLLISLILTLPAPLQIIVQIAQVALTRADYCSMPLLRDPLTVERIGRAARVLDILLMGDLPAPATSPAAGLDGGVTEAATCRSLIGFLNLVACVILPLLIAARRYPPEATAGWWWRFHKRRPRPAPAPASRGWRATAAVRRAELAFHRLLTGEDLRPVQRGTGLLFVLCACWAAAQMAAEEAAD